MARWLISASVLLVLLCQYTSESIAQRARESYGNQSATVVYDTKVSGIEVARHGGGLVVRVRTSRPLEYEPEKYAMSSPPRIVLDLYYTSNGLGTNAIQYNQGDLRSVEMQQGNDRLRITFLLSQAATLRTETSDDGVYLYLNEGVLGAGGTVAVDGQVVDHAVRDINFRLSDSDGGRVVIDLSDANIGVDVTRTANTVVVNLLDTALPKSLNRNFDVTDFGTPVQLLEAYSTNQGSRVVLRNEGNWEHAAYQQGTQFFVDVVETVNDPNELGSSARGYTGEKLSLNFQNVDIRLLLQVIGEFTNNNIVVSETVDGTITLVLNDVPWDQALDIIMRQKGLGMRRNGNVMLISPKSEIAEQEQAEREVQEKRAEVESLTTETFQLNYHKASEVSQLFKSAGGISLLSPRGSMLIDERSNKIFVSDVASSVRKMRDLVREIDLEVPQVLIEARIVEADESFVRNVGVRLGLNNSEPINLGSGNQLNIGHGLESTAGYSGQGGDATSIGSAGDNLLVNLPAAGAGGSAASQFSFVLFNAARTRFLNLELSAAQSDGRGKIVSNPRIVTADNVEASIEQGVQIPYQAATSSGATSVSFANATLALKVKPRISPDGKIALKISVTKDSPNSSVSSSAGVAIDTRRLDTEVLIDSGGTVVIGGIYTEELSQVERKVPLLGDLPIIGNLFRDSAKEHRQRELLVFISPKIVSSRLNPIPTAN